MIGAHGTAPTSLHSSSKPISVIMIPAPCRKPINRSFRSSFLPVGAYRLRNTTRSTMNDFIPANSLYNYIYKFGVNSFTLPMISSIFYRIYNVLSSRLIRHGECKHCHERHCAFEHYHFIYVVKRYTERAGCRGIICFILALKVIPLDRLQGIICSVIQEPYLLGFML